MNNLIRLPPPPLTLNERFIYAFADEDGPCAALGLVESLGQELGFMAVKLTDPLPPQVANSGFDFGFEVLGNERYQLLHFVLNVKGIDPYDIIVNPNNPVVRKVMETMRETRQYFFLFVEEGSLAAFHNDMGPDNVEWFRNYGDVIYTATTSDADYSTSLQRIKTKEGMLHGRLLDWVCRDDMEAINLETNRLVVRSR